MRKFLTNLMMVILVFSLSSFMACGLENGNESHQEEETEIILSDLPETIEAELGERCNIPAVTAKVGDREIEVVIEVKDSKGGAVELEGRGIRFHANDIEGYTIYYSAEYKDLKAEKVIAVSVVDTRGPAIDFSVPVDNLTAKVGEKIKVPVADWTDKSGEVKNDSYKVLHNNVEVDVTDGEFVASEYGVYTIVYMAQDVLGHKTEFYLDINCLRIVELAGFDDLTHVWAQPANSEITTEHAVEGNAFKVTCDNTWLVVAVYPLYYDLSGFDALQLNVYAEQDMNTSDEGLYFLNKKYTLSAGENIITISKEDLYAQYPDGRIPSTTKPQYYNVDYLWFQAKAESGSIYLDQLIGVYDNYIEDIKAPVIDLGKNAFFDKMSVKDGSALKVPEAIAYDNSMEELVVNHVVIDDTGADITEVADSGKCIAKEGKTYTIVYTSKDSASNTGTKTVNVEVEPKVAIPDIDRDDYFPEYSKYDMLQDFEEPCVDWAPEVEHTLEQQHVLSGENSVHLTTEQADRCIVIRLLKDSKRLETVDWEQYEYIQAYVYANCENARLDFYTKTFQLAGGPNIIKITAKDIIAEIAKADNVYDVNGGFYFQFTTGNIFVDSIIGVYPAGDIPEPPEEIKNYYPVDRQFDLLQGFEDESALGLWFFPDSKKIVTTKGVKDNAFQINAAEANWSKLPMMIKKNGNILTEEDWRAYEYFKLSVYSKNACKFAFLNKIYDLTAGYNVITITSGEILEQINSNTECYPATGRFWCQVAGTDIELTFDELIGVYDENGKPEPEVPDDPVAVPDEIKNYYPVDRQFDLLQGFEDESALDLWFFPDSKKIVATKGVKDNAFQINAAEANWSKLPMMIKKNGNILMEEDWRAYEYFKLSVYSKNACKFAFLNKIYDLTAGYNVITITSGEILEQINSNTECYPATGWFWCQVAGMDIELTFDELIGVCGV